MFRSSLLQVVNFRSGGKSDIRKKGERRRMFLKSTYSFFFSFLLFLLRSGTGTSRKVVSALNSRADVTSRLINVYMCFLGSLLSSLTRFTENPSIYLSPPAPKSFTFWRDCFPFNFNYFSFFLIFNWMDAWSRCVATRLYILYVAADESTSSWEFYC